LISSADLSKEGKTTADLAVVRNDFADQYPDVVALWAQLHDRAVALYRSDPTAAATAIGHQLNLTPDDALAQAKELIWLSASEQATSQWLGTGSAAGGLVDNLLSAADFLKSQDVITNVPPRETFTKGVDPTFVERAAAGQ
jgi:taurine transport system substrate-binding protein